METREHKRQLRRELRSQRRAWRGAARARAEARLCELIAAHPSVQRAKWVACYRAFDGEVDLSGLWSGVWGGRDPINLSEVMSEAAQPGALTPSPLYSLRSRLVFPQHSPHTPLTFVRPTRWVSAGSSALKTPEGELVNTSEIGVILTPGVAFCPKRGARLGLGGGHYDRTLAQKDELSWSVEAFGVGFSFQICADLPVESWDVTLSGVFTELGLHRTSKGDV